VANAETTPRRCADGQIHLFFYSGKGIQKYTCQRCDFVISKADLKAGTDA